MWASWSLVSSSAVLMVELTVEKMAASKAVLTVEPLGECWGKPRGNY